MTEVFERSHEQRMSALELANEIRIKRAALKRELTFDRALEVIYEPAEWLKGMKVYDLLRALPWFGKTKSDRMLRMCQIAPHKTIGGISWRQRERLMNDLRSEADRRDRESGVVR